jgi:hypothetical protein
MFLPHRSVLPRGNTESRFESLSTRDKLIFTE